MTVPCFSPAWIRPIGAIRVASLAVGIRRDSTVVSAIAISLVIGCGNDHAPPDGGTVQAISHISDLYRTNSPSPGVRNMPSAAATVSNSPSPTRSTAPTATPSPSRAADPESPPQPVDPTLSQDPLIAAEDEVLELTNLERERRGCDPLRPNDQLHEAARAHSTDMAERNYFDHVSPEGSGPAERATDAGYDAWAAENIAMGYPTAEDVVAGWMNSKGHRENILNCDFRAIGVGLAESSRGNYWTQMFGYA